MKNKYIILKSECKKVYFQPFVFVAIVVFMIINCINIFRNDYQFRKSDYISVGRYNMKKLYCGELTDKQIEDISINATQATAMISKGDYTTDYNPQDYYSGYAYGDAQLWIELNERIKKISDFQEYNSKIVENTIRYQNSLDNQYLINVNQLIEKKYQNRKVSGLYNNDGFADLFDYHFSSSLLLILLLLGVCSSYTTEKENSMTLMLRTCKSGGICTSTFKCIAMVIYSFIINLCFSLCDLFMFFICYRFNGYTQPIYSISGYENSPVVSSVLSVIVLCFFMRWLCLCTLGSIVLLLSKIANKTYYVFIGSILLLALLMVASTVGTNLLGNYLNCFNPINLILPSKHFKEFNFIKIGNIPLITYTANIIGVFLIFTICTLLNCFDLRRTK